MIKTYFILGLRNQSKNKLSSLINILGLTLAFACSTVVYFFISYTRCLDQFHESVDDIYLLSHYPLNSPEQAYGIVPSNLSDRIKEYPQVDNVLRIENKSGIVSSNQKTIKERISFCDINYLDIFSFQTLSGSSKCLHESKIIISKTIAEKFFGLNPAVDETMKIAIGDKTFNYIIGAVIETLPSETSFDIDIILPYRDLNKYGNEISNWNFFSTATFVEASSKEKLEYVIQQLSEELELYNSSSKDWQIQKWGYHPLNRLSLDAYKIKNSLSIGYGPPSGLMAMVFIGLVILVLSIVNYINTSIAISISRVSEIGLRKVLGSNKRDFIFQFFIENTLQIFLAFVLSIWISIQFLIPTFNNLFSLSITHDFSDFLFWVYFTALFFMTSLVASAYPAGYVSNFQPNVILSHKQKFSFDKPLIKVFTFTQSILAFLAISISFFFIKNENYLKDKDLGYETDNKVVIKINNIKSKELLYANLQSNLNVQNISYSVNRLGLNGIQTNVMFRDIVFKADLYEVGYGYLEQMDISMVEGRFFDTNLDVNTNGVLINRNLFETYLKSKLRLGSTTMKINDTNYTILGIVENTFTNLSSDKDNLVIFKVCSLNDANYIIASFDAINREKVLKSIEDSWNETEKETPIDSFFYDKIFLTYIIWVTGHRKVMTFVAIISIVLSVIGLFSLMSLKVSSKLKSFCIMKILGISELSLFIRLGKDLLWITALTLISGVPLSLWITKLLFSIVYIDHVPITPLIPSITSAIFFLIFFSITIVNFQKVIEKDPIQLIRSD